MFMDLVCYIYFSLPFLPYLRVRTWYSSVGVGTGWTARVQFPAVQDFPLLNIVQTGSGAHTAFYPMGTGGFFPGVKAAGV
jgi:hypothetical protein